MQQLDNDKFRRVWERVSPEQHSPEDTDYSAKLLNILEKERILRGAYGSLARCSDEFDEMWCRKADICRALAAEYFIRTGTVPDSLGIKKKLTATPENLRRWYILEQEVQELYAAAGIGGGDEVSRECSEKLRHMLELCL